MKSYKSIGHFIAKSPPKETRRIVTSSLSFTIIMPVYLASSQASVAQGLFNKLPADGSWVTFDFQYTFKSQDAVQSGNQIMTMGSVGKVVEDSGLCRWIEYNIHAIEDSTEKIWIRKLLIPEKYLKLGENPTSNVIRGWTKSAGENVIERAVPFHGRWPAYLAGPLHDEKKLPKKIV